MSRVFDKYFLIRILYLENISYLQTEDKFAQSILELNSNIGKRASPPFILELTDII